MSLKPTRSQFLIGRVMGTCILVAASLLMAQPAVAAASDPPDAPVSGVTSAPLVAPDGVGPKPIPGTDGYSTGIVPAVGCGADLFEVHKSGGMASVHGRTTCAGASRNYISLSIGYIGWFGERYAVAYNDATSSRTYVEGQVKSVCSGMGWQTWRAFGYHSTTRDGRVYYGNTDRHGRFDC